MKYSTTTAACVLSVAGSALAVPLLSLKLDVGNNMTAADLAEKIAVVAPMSTSCSSQFPECVNNTAMAPHFLNAFNLYEITEPGQIAGVLALTAFESGDYKYKHNTNPDHHGQGTSNQQMAEWNYKYAKSIPELKSEVAKQDPGTSDAQKDAILNLVVPDEYNFGTGPWFLKNQCSPAVLTALARGDDAGFQEYMGCVGTTMTEERQAYWNRAKSAFGLNK
ncbi:hypothetical protein F4810DRAFT_338864 [Camillea tinctor]|nr:hypothetical protein F4810DRAFT_338864 [Camillea tinctor]